MFWDLEKSFNTIYRQATRESKKIADDAIKQHHENLQKPNLLWRWLTYSIRFQPVPAILAVFAMTMGAVVVTALLVRLFRYILGGYADLVLVLMMLISGLLYLVLSTLIIILADRASSQVNLSERRQTTADLIVEKWLAKKYPLEDLVLAFKSSLNTLKVRRSFYVGITFTVGVFLNFFKLLIGDDAALRKIFINLAGVTFPSSSSFVISFSIVAVGTFVLISVPIAWREQLEPFLFREVERRKP